MLPPSVGKRLDPLVAGHVLVVGAGGIGCPAAWGLRAAGVERITLIDPDLVERSNLPRQVLFESADLGQAKALVAAARLGGAAARVRGVAERLDERNGRALLADVDVVIDATDGARTKDWVNHLAVQSEVPLVHAAGIRSEGRLLSVGAGGRPCLACLFGRLTEETGSCADLGVWNGVVGTVGFLAAQAAVRRLGGSSDPEPSYAVLDFETPSAFALPVPPDLGCPVCAVRAGELERLPEPPACAVPSDAAAASADTDLDLRTERCPMNLLRARQALESAESGAVLRIRLGAEGAATVPDGVRALGHEVLEAVPEGGGVRLRVRRGVGAAADTESAERESGGPPQGADALHRFARQIVLPEIGEGGQRRLCGARVRVAGPAGAGADVARTYLRAAGVKVLEPDGEPADLLASMPAAPDRTLVAMARGAAFADAVERLLVAGERTGVALPLQRDGAPGGAAQGLSLERLP